MVVWGIISSPSPSFLSRRSDSLISFSLSLSVLRGGCSELSVETSLLYTHSKVVIVMVKVCAGGSPARRRPRERTRLLSEEEVLLLVTSRLLPTAPPSLLSLSLPPVYTFSTSLLRHLAGRRGEEAKSPRTSATFSLPPSPRSKFFGVVIIQSDNGRKP